MTAPTLATTANNTTSNLPNILSGPILTGTGRVIGMMVTTIVFLLGVVFLQSCKPQDEVVTNAPGSELTASADTIRFDTVITSLWSPSRRLKIYNPNDAAVTISRISLSQGGPFQIQMFVNGRPGPMQDNILLRGKDSLLVLLQVNLSSTAAGRPFFLRDSLTIATVGLPRKKVVQLEAWGQNAIFFDGDTIKTSEVWDDSLRPYYIRNSILVPDNVTLTIKQGVKVYNFENSNILVTGRLLVQGTRSQPVVFTGTRQEPRFDLQPNQWGAIAILGNNPQGSIIQNAIIKNGLRGVQVGVPGNNDRPRCYISNCRIQAHSEWGIAAFNAVVTATNNKILDCGTQNIAMFKGGNYAFVHNTSGYTGKFGFSRNDPSVVFLNYWRVSEGVYERADMNLFFRNNVVAGSRLAEFFFDNSQGGSSAFNVNIRGNAVRTDRNTADLTAAGNILLDSRFRFNAPLLDDVSYDSSSAVAQKGIDLSVDNVSTDFPEVLLDYRGRPRIAATPDAGALNSDRSR